MSRRAASSAPPCTRCFGPVGSPRRISSPGWPCSGSRSSRWNLFKTVARGRVPRRGGKGGAQMRKALAVGKKEFRQIVRDRRTLMILLFIPVFFLLLYGYALNFDIKHVRAGRRGPGRQRGEPRPGLGVPQLGLLRPGRHAPFAAGSPAGDGRQRGAGRADHPREHRSLGPGRGQAAPVQIIKRVVVASRTLAAADPASSTTRNRTRFPGRLARCSSIAVFLAEPD